VGKRAGQCRFVTAMARLFYGSFVLLTGDGKHLATGLRTVGTQVTEAPDRQTQGDEQPEAAPQLASSRVPVIAVSLAALAVIGAATANSLPNFQGFALPDFNQFSLPDVDRFSLPDFSRFTPPYFNRVAAPPPPPPPPVLVPDPVVRAGLRDLQTSQEQNAAVLELLTQSSVMQQADLKRITRQLAVLSAQVNSLQNPMTPPTTSSIPPSTTSSIAPSMPPSILPPMTSSIPRPHPRARVVHASRKLFAPVLPPVLPATLAPLPKPAGPVSVGGAPLSPAPGSDAS
jgi:hypothetical protein